MTHKTLLAVLLSAGLSIVACKKDDPTHETKTFAFDFGKGAQEWTAGFSDYHDTASDMELKSEIASLPAPLNTAVKAFKIQGHNRSDDLFMFLKRKVTGLEPNKTYRVAIDIVLASNAPSGAVGVGGAPGESVYLKAGAVGVEPIVSKKSDGYFEINTKKGQQSNAGEEMKVVGNVANGTDQPKYVSLTRKTEGLSVKTDASGSAWLIVGTDSGYEGLTVLYYQSVQARFDLQD